MKFLCPNCKAKYRIGPEKLEGRQAAKIRCRNCDYRIQIQYQPGSDDYEITATPTSVAPAPAPTRVAKAQGVKAVRPGAGRPAPARAEGGGVKRPTAAVPGLPGLGSSRSARGAALHADLAASPAPQPRRPLAPPPPAPFAGAAVAIAPAPEPRGALPFAAQPALAAVPAPSPQVVPPRATSAGTQLGDQFRQSVQGAGSPAAAPLEELPQEGWFVGVNGVPLGPIPLGDLRELAIAGHIDRRSLVWREGQAEWKPLGKFPQLVRLVEDGVGPSAGEANGVHVNGVGAPAPFAASPPGNAPAEPVVAPGPPPSSAAPPSAERPSAWGDLDDEEEEDADEQPTTVKGRVSMPPAAAPPATLSNPMGLAPVAAPGAPLPSGSVRNTGAFALAPSPADGALTPVAAEASADAVAVPAPIISSMPEPIGEPDMGLARVSQRGKLYRWFAVVAAFVLGVILTLVVSSDGEEERPALAEQSEVAPAAASPAAADLMPAAPPAPDPEPAVAADEPEVTEPEASAGSRAGTARVTRPAMGALTVTTPAESPPPPKPNPLLSGLSGPATPGPSAGTSGSEARGSGLDATAIGRTVRRYSPAVRQNCWQRALNTRAPGTPPSAKVTALITVEPSGKVRSVSVSGAPRGYPGLARCIEGAVKGWSFPRSASETVTNVPFVFVGQ